MRAVFALAAALFLQVASLSSNDPIAEPQHFRYQRSISLPVNATGQACTILDANVFAHAASESLNDLRLYAPSGETPFNFSISGTQSTEDDPALLRNIGIASGDLVFDIEMPRRPYSAVVLDLAAKDFLGTAAVSSSDGHGGVPTDLGTFAIFDLTFQHLSRSTTLPLQESTFPELHIALHLTPAPGSLKHDLGPSILHGVTVPPSREAQTLYTAVASTTTFTRHGRETIATIHLPAHVPVERIAFTLDSKFKRNFLRSVTIAATPDGNRDPAATETLTGQISHVTLPQEIEPREPAIDSGDETVDTALGADLRTGATVKITVQNGDDPPLPLTSAQLEMRQRKICFDATGSSYILRYGDPALRAPVYDYARLFIASAKPIPATLSPEQRNPGFVARLDTRPYTERHPEILWIGLLAVLAVLGSIALRSARRQGRH